VKPGEKVRWIKITDVTTVFLNGTTIDRKHRVNEVMVIVEPIAFGYKCKFLKETLVPQDFHTDDTFGYGDETIDIPTDQLFAL